MYPKSVLILAAAAMATAAYGVSRPATADRYEQIPERNLFGLKPRETPAAQEPQRPPLRKVILTGVTTLGGYKRALLKVEPLAGHAGEKEESLILTEGQREGDIEVVQINEKTGKVTLNNAGVTETITFEKQAPSLPAGAPGHMPGMPVGSTAAVPPPALPAAPSPTGRPYSRQRAGWPMNTAVAPAAPGSVSPTNPGTPVVPTPNPANPVPQDLTPEEQAIIAAIQQQSAAASNPIPPNTVIPATPGATAPALSPPGLVPPQTVTPAQGAVNPQPTPQQPIMPQ